MPSLSRMTSSAFMLSLKAHTLLMIFYDMLLHRQLLFIEQLTLLAQQNHNLKELSHRPSDYHHLIVLRSRYDHYG